MSVGALHDGDVLGIAPPGGRPSWGRNSPPKPLPESGEGSKDREALPPSQTVWLWLGNKGH